ncbi:hypothetical protein MJO29_012389 [Puccinia striiformis f. sp. tritici]|nr:hypothetical protein MJO29_012389 [Puccinia striiformis f. sp. tritici]
MIIDDVFDPESPKHKKQDFIDFLHRHDKKIRIPTKLDFDELLILARARARALANARQQRLLESAAPSSTASTRPRRKCTLAPKTGTPLPTARNLPVKQNAAVPSNTDEKSEVPMQSAPVTSLVPPEAKVTPKRAMTIKTEVSATSQSQPHETEESGILHEPCSPMPASASSTSSTNKLKSQAPAHSASQPTLALSTAGIIPKKAKPAVKKGRAGSPLPAYQTASPTPSHEQQKCDVAVHSILGPSHVPTKVEVPPKRAAKPVHKKQVQVPKSLSDELKQCNTPGRPPQNSPITSIKVPTRERPPTRSTHNSTSTEYQQKARVPTRTAPKPSLVRTKAKATTKHKVVKETNTFQVPREYPFTVPQCGTVITWLPAHSIASTTHSDDEQEFEVGLIASQITSEDEQESQVSPPRPSPVPITVQVVPKSAKPASGTPVMLVSPHQSDQVHEDVSPLCPPESLPSQETMSQQYSTPAHVTSTKHDSQGTSPPDLHFGAIDVHREWQLLSPCDVNHNQRLSIATHTDQDKYHLRSPSLTREISPGRAVCEADANFVAPENAHPAKQTGLRSAVAESLVDLIELSQNENGLPVKQPNYLEMSPDHGPLPAPIPHDEPPLLRLNFPEPLITVPKSTGPPYPNKSSAYMSFDPCNTLNSESSLDFETLEWPIPVKQIDTMSLVEPNISDFQTTRPHVPNKFRLDRPINNDEKPVVPALSVPFTLPLHSECNALLWSDSSSNLPINPPPKSSEVKSADCLAPDLWTTYSPSSPQDSTNLDDHSPVITAASCNLTASAGGTDIQLPESQSPGSPLIKRANSYCQPWSETSAPALHNRQAVKLKTLVTTDTTPQMEDLNNLDSLAIHDGIMSPSSSSCQENSDVPLPLVGTLANLSDPPCHGSQTSDERKTKVLHPCQLKTIMLTEQEEPLLTNIDSPETLLIDPHRILEFLPANKPLVIFNTVLADSSSLEKALHDAIINDKFN